MLLLKLDPSGSLLVDKIGDTAKMMAPGTGLL
jgi:hypothetical protein